MTGPTPDEVADVLVELLAEDAGMAPEEVRIALTAGGPAWPVDSLLIVEILQKVEDRFGVRIPETKEAAAACSSVRAFAAVVSGLAAEGDSSGGTAA